MTFDSHLECACCGAEIAPGEGVECHGCFRLVCPECINYDTPDHHDRNCDCCLGIYDDKMKIKRLAADPAGLAALISALGQTPPADLPANPALRDLAADESPWWAAQVLGELGDRRATPYLAAALREGPPPTRQFAARALGELADPSAVDALIKALDDDETKVRVEAMMALGKLGGPRAESSLLAVLRNRTDPGRWAAAWGLADLASKAAAPDFLAELKAPHSKLIGLAARGLAAAGQTEAAPVLADLVADPGLNLTDLPQVIAALGRLGDESALPALRRYLGSSIPETAQAAREAIRLITDPRSAGEGG